MIVTCEKCGNRFDDETRWTICPHNSLNVAHDTPYCRRHDLYNCPLCLLEVADTESIERTGHPLQ